MCWDDQAKAAYEAYYEATPGGRDLTPWSELDAATKAIWEAVAGAVRDEINSDYDSVCDWD